MSYTNDRTTLICLFHHQAQAEAALKDLYQGGVEHSAVTVISGGDAGDGSGNSLESLGVPSRDLKNLQRGLDAGGMVVAVVAISDRVDTVERIFGQHRADKIDEVVTEDEAPLVSAGLAAGAAIPVVDEDLQIGKRTVDQGGVRVYRRVVEIPAEETIALREEHVVVERRAVDRAATPEEFARQGDRSIELVETAEEAVVSKSARVVEEVIVGKQVGEHTEHIQETLRRTEVEVEQLPATGVPVDRTRRSNN